MIYTPREDSFLLTKHLSRCVKNRSFLDMGSGSGIQSDTALKFKAKSITASDINEESIKLLKNKFKSSQKIKIIKSNLFSKIKGKFDVIAFNPPYLPEDKREDAASARATTGGKHGDEVILQFLKQAPKHLNKTGTILLIVSSLTPQNKINNLLKKLKLKKTIIDQCTFFMEILELWRLKATP